MLISLTESQRSQFSKWVRRYTDLSLSCETSDKFRAEHGIRDQYRLAGLNPPKQILWVPSPVEGINLLASLVSGIHSSQSVRGAMYESVSVLVHEAIKEAIEENSARAVARAVRQTVVDEVTRSVLNAINENVWKSVSRSIPKFDSYFRGSDGLSFVAYVTFFRDVVGIKVPIEPREDTDVSCGWWWPYRDFCVVSDRPKEIHRDNEGRLHNPNGPAISWRDGEELFFWRDQPVNREWVLKPDSIDPQLALIHPNIELRRCIAEIVGWKKVMEILAPKTIDIDPDPMIGTLLEARVGRTQEKFLQVRCGTGRDFVLPVPPEMTTALQANAWTYGIDGLELRGLESRT